MMLYLGLACLLVVHCESVPPPEPNENRLGHASNDLAFDLLRSYSSKKNVFISPLSISTALALVYLGADGTTAEAMRQVLKYDQYSLSFEQVQETFESLRNRLEQNTTDYQLSSYNGVLVQKDFTILHIYGHAVKLYYNANIETVDFEKQGQEVQSKINSDVEKATRGKIKNFLTEPPRPDTKLFILNAVYFLGNWENPFNPDFTYEGVFYNNGAQEKKVQMMNRDGSYLYSKETELDASLVVLPYKGNSSASMIILLPNQKDGVVSLQQKLTQQSLDKALSTASEGRIILSVPKFSMEYSADLAEALSQLGLGEIFSNNANFWRMVGDTAKIKVSKITHKAVIDVNEKGSEAAAATGVEIVPTSLPPEFKVDHPFIFLIRDQVSGAILFSGRVDEL